jgi:hypothetical protein
VDVSGASVGRISTFIQRRLSFLYNTVIISSYFWSGNPVSFWTVWIGVNSLAPMAVFKTRITCPKYCTAFMLGVDRDYL